MTLYAPDGRPIEDVMREKERMDDRRGPAARHEVTVTRIDLSFGNVVVLALKIGAVWFVLGVVGALIVLALN